LARVEEYFLNTEGDHMHDNSVSSAGIEFEGALDLPKLTRRLAMRAW